MITIVKDVQEKYKEKLMTPAEAVAGIESGSTIIQPLGAGEPPALLAAIADAVEAGKLKNITMHAMLPLANTLKTVLRPDLPSEINWNRIFSGVDRKAYKEGRATYTPNHFHQAPVFSLSFAKSIRHVPLWLLDRHGCFSLGVSVDYNVDVSRSPPALVEVNPNMPMQPMVLVFCTSMRSTELSSMRPPTELRLAKFQLR